MMEYNEEGFLYPVVDKAKCIKCKKCIDACQMFGVKRFPEPKHCYASWSKHEEVRANSASGAIFYELARKVLSQGGIVCGAAFVGDFEVKHIIVDDGKNLHKLQGSKYLQSDCGDCFVPVRKALIEGKSVLFSGTGCQVAGLKKFLKKDYSNLLTVDIVCHGVPSPGVFKDYINEMRQIFGDFDKVTFRDKINGWNWNFYFTLYRRNNIIHRDVVGLNIYLTAFLRHYILRRCCHSCEFATTARCSDITIADFWNIKQSRPDLDDTKGTSLILLHSQAGEKAFEAITSELARFEKLDMKFAFNSNANLKRPSPPHTNRQKFFDYYAKTRKVTEWFDKEFNTVGILNFHYANNIGAVLVAYSLTKAVRKLGYNAEIINYRPGGKVDKDKFEEFRVKYIPQSPLYSSIDELSKTKYRRLIVGSDQVWKLGNTEMFMLAWASGYRSLNAYAASFGDSRYSGSIDKSYAEKLLHRFDSISVREDSGVNICNQTFKVHGEHVLDPTFLLPASDYEQLIEDEKNKLKASKSYIFIACYSNENNRILNHEKRALADFPDYQIVDLWKLKSPSIGQLLTLIKNASYVVTDSFHMTVFSVIFNKQFISLVPLGFNGLDRIPSLLYGFGLKDRIRTNLLNVDGSCFEQIIDYTVTNTIIEEKREKSLSFLKQALQKNILYKDPVSLQAGIGNSGWKDFLREKKIPFFLKPMSDLDKNYLMFFIGSVDNSIHYEITKPQDGLMKIALHFENKKLISEPDSMKMVEAIAEKLANDGFEYVPSAMMVGIRKVINAVEFDKVFSKLVYDSLFEVYRVVKEKPQDELRLILEYIKSQI